MITQKIIARTDSLKLDKIISRYGEDSMRQVVFVIVRPEPDSEDLIPITIPEDAVGSFRILKPSGNFVIVPMSKSVLATGETAFDVVIPASANTAKGSGYYDIRITSDTDKYYFTAQGDFLIDDNIISDEVLEDVSEVNGLIFPDDFLTIEDHVAYIDDNTISTDSTWSSNKINEEIEAHAGGDVSKTVSGNPVIFTDGASAPLVKCVTEIQGSQDLHGYDKPWVGGSLNVLTPYSYSKTNVGVSFNYSSDGSFSVSGSPSTPGGAAAPIRADATSFTTTLPAGTYTPWLTPIPNVSVQVVKMSDGSILSTGDSFTLNNSTELFMRLNVTSAITGTATGYLQIVSGSVALPWDNICPITPYTEGEIEVSNGDGNTTTHTTTYPSAIYRGSEDVVKGEVVTDWGMIDSYAGESLPGEWISDRDEYAPGTTPTTGAQVAYELATPTTLSVTPTNLPIKSLSGYTHIESSTGDMEVEYITERFQPLIDSIKQL